MARKREARVTKRSSSASTGSRMSRDRAGRWTTAALSSSSTAALREMLDEGLDIRSSAVEDAEMGEDEHVVVAEQWAGDQEMESLDDLDAGSPLQDKGKGRMIEEDEAVVEELKDEELTGEQQHEEVGEEQKFFPIMDLPTEIRLEIYRACLTRPYKILLSKPEQQPVARPQLVTHEGEQPSNGSKVIDLNRGLSKRDEQRLNAAGIYQQLRVNRGVTHTNSGASTAGGTNNMRSLARSRSLQIPPRGPPRLHFSTPSAPSSSTSNAPAPPLAPYRPTTSRLNRRTVKPTSTPLAKRGASSEDPLIVNILRTSKEVYKEARDVLYSENVFDLDINTAVNSLAALHQRSRRHIKHVELEIPTYTEILERFSEIVRLSLRYCTGLKKFVIHTPFTLPGADGYMSSSNTTVYANGFDILRWLPQQCQVVLMGSKNAEIETVVSKHLILAKTQDKAQWARVEPSLRFCE